MKKIIVLCDLGVGGERGRVLYGGGIATSVTATEYKDPLKVIKVYGEQDNHTWRHREYRPTEPR